MISKSINRRCFLVKKCSQTQSGRKLTCHQILGMKKKAVTLQENKLLNQQDALRLFLATCMATQKPKSSRQPACLVYDKLSAEPTSHTQKQRFRSCNPSERQRCSAWPSGAGGYKPQVASRPSPSDLRGRWQRHGPVAPWQQWRSASNLAAGTSWVLCAGNPGQRQKLQCVISVRTLPFSRAHVSVCGTDTSGGCVCAYGGDAILNGSWDQAKVSASADDHTKATVAGGSSLTLEQCDTNHINNRQFRGRFNKSVPLLMRVAITCCLGSTQVHTCSSVTLAKKTTRSGNNSNSW